MLERVEVYSWRVKGDGMLDSQMVCFNSNSYFYISLTLQKHSFLPLLFLPNSQPLIQAIYYSVGKLQRSNGDVKVSRVETKPIDGQKPGTSGLRKKVNFLYLCTKNCYIHFTFNNLSCILWYIISFFFFFNPLVCYFVYLIFVYSLRMYLCASSSLFVIDSNLFLRH